MDSPNGHPILLVGEVEQYEEDCACPDHNALILFEGQPERWTNDCACPETSLAVQRREGVDDLLWTRVWPCRCASITNWM